MEMGKDACADTDVLGNASWTLKHIADTPEDFFCRPVDMSQAC